jgi:hypothetical protein
VSTALEKYYSTGDVEVRKIFDEREDLVEKVGEESPAVRQLDQQIALMRERAVVGAAQRHQYLSAKLAGVKAELHELLEALEQDERYYKSRLEALERIIKQALPPGPDAEIVTDNVNVFYTGRAKVEITNADDLPIDCLRVKTEPSLTKIGELMDAGEQVPGAQRVINYSLQIKFPSATAKKNAASRAKRRAEKVIDGREAFKEIGSDE